MCRPLNRKRLIRDLPVGMVKLLDVAYRPILLAKKKHAIRRVKRWRMQNQPHRIARNIVKKYKKWETIPRVLPFACERCGLHSKHIPIIRNHDCEPPTRMRTRKGVKNQRTAIDVRKLQDPQKYWKSGGLAIMEQSRHPEKLQPFVETLTKVEEGPSDTKVLTKQFGGLQTNGTKRDAIPRPSKVVSENTEQLVCHDCTKPGVLCYGCKNVFEDYNKFQLHCRDVEEGPCAGTIPDYTEIEKMDRTVTFRMREPLRQAPFRRNVSNVKCTVCNKTGFANTGELHEHMLGCQLDDESFEQWMERQSAEDLERGSSPRRPPFPHYNCD